MEAATQMYLKLRAHRPGILRRQEGDGRVKGSSSGARGAVRVLPNASGLSYTIRLMKLEINPRGNGACPLCSATGNCRIHKLLASGVEEAEADSEMEIVVYTCPYFSERDGA